MRISDWSSDVCSSDLVTIPRPEPAGHAQASFGDRLGDKGGDVGTCDAGVATSGDALSGGQQRDVRGAPGKRALGRDEPRLIGGEIGRGTGRERARQDVSIPAVAVAYKNKPQPPQPHKPT